MKYNPFSKSSILLTALLMSSSLLQGCKPGQYPVEVDVVQDFEVTSPGNSPTLIKRGDPVSASVSNGFAGNVLTLNGRNISLDRFGRNSKYDISNWVKQGTIELSTQIEETKSKTITRRDSCYHSYYGCGFDVTQGEYSCGFKNEWGYKEVTDVIFEQTLKFTGIIRQERTEVANFKGSVPTGTRTETTTGDCRSNVGNF